MLRTRPTPAWGAVLALLAVVLLTAACGGSAAPATKSTAPSQSSPAAAPAQQDAPPAAASASAPAQAAPRELLKVRIGVPSIDTDALPVTVPLKKGYFADEGLDVEVIRIAANNAVTATTVGELELSTTIGSTVVAASQGYPLRVIAVVHGMPMDAVVGRRDARTLNDLRGGRMAVSSPGATIDLLGRAAVKQVGLEPDQDVAMLGMGEESNRYNALQLGQVDAAVLGPPVIYEAEAEGFPILADVGELVPIAMNGLVAHETTLRDRPDLVKRFLRAYIRGLQFMRQNRAETVRFVTEAEGLSDVAIAEKTYDRMLKAMSDDAMAPESTIARYVQLAKDAGRISNEAGGLASLDYTLTREAWREVQR
jgi:ABC-type nitrate/sulfonate/bicarbonate transport system substrate-binding protein